MIELTLPLPPNRANAREHWRVTHRKKKEYYATARNALSRQLPSHGRLNDDRVLEWFYSDGVLPRCSITATIFVKKKFDPDNRVALLKWPIDCLVHFGLLADDSDEWLDFTQIPTQVVDRKNTRVVIQLEATPPAITR